MATQNLPGDFRDDEYGKAGHPAEVTVRYCNLTPEVLNAVNVILADQPLSGTAMMDVPMRKGATFIRCSAGDFGTGEG